MTMQMIVLAGAIVASALACSSGNCQSGILCNGKKTDPEDCSEGAMRIQDQLQEKIQGSVSNIVNTYGSCVVALKGVLEEAKELHIDDAGQRKGKGMYQRLLGAIGMGGKDRKDEASFCDFANAVAHAGSECDPFVGAITGCANDNRTSTALCSFSNKEEKELGRIAAIISVYSEFASKCDKGDQYAKCPLAQFKSAKELKAFIASLIKVIQDVKDIGEDATILQQQLAIAANKLVELENACSKDLMALSHTQQPTGAIGRVGGLFAQIAGRTTSVPCCNFCALVNTILGLEKDLCADIHMFIHDLAEHAEQLPVICQPSPCHRRMNAMTGEVIPSNFTLVGGRLLCNMMPMNPLCPTCPTFWTM